MMLSGNQLKVTNMIEKIHKTRCGDIHYWISDTVNNDNVTLMFLPGLTADHRLFEKQIEYFESKCNVFVWDAPAHADSWPFSFDFTLKDKAVWLNEIIDNENISDTVIRELSNNYQGFTSNNSSKVIFISKVESKK